MSGVLEGTGLLDAAAAHGPAGTLGWLLLGALAAAAVVLEAKSRRPAWPAWLAAAGVSTYALASWAAVAEAVAALLALVAVAGFAGALAPALRAATPLTVPHLGVLAAVVVVAAVPLLDLLPAAAPAARVPFRVAGARSPSVVALAVLVGTALAEWRLLTPHRPVSADSLGLAQVLLLVVGWVTLLAGAAADSLALLVASVAFQAIAVVLFLARLAPVLGRLQWRGADRWAGAAALSLAAYVGVLSHLAVGVAGGRYVDAALVPSWLLFTVDHVVFVGVAANLLLGLGRGQPVLVFWVVNAGLVATAVGLAAGAPLVAEPAAAVLGVGLLLGAAIAVKGPNGTGSEPSPGIASGA